MRLSATSELTVRQPPELLAWDSEFWGVKVGKATHSDGLSAWAREHTVGLVCLLVDTPEEAQRAEQNGARFMDIRVTLERPTAKLETVARPFLNRDADVLAAIARESHRVTRFYADPRLPDERCDDLYEGWIRQSLDGWATEVYVVDYLGGPAGYVTVHVDGDTSSLGLIAVAPFARRQGLGRELVHAALSHGVAKRMRVVTQGRNIEAQRLFQKCGFRTTETAVWLHQWTTP